MTNFPTRAPVGMILGSVLGILSFVPVFGVWHHFQPPLERFYLSQYAGSMLAQTPVGTVISFFFHSRRNVRTYFVLMQGGRPVTNSMLLDPNQHISVRSVETTPRIFATWLRAQIYGGREFHRLLRVPLALSYAVGLSFLVVGCAVDFRRRKRAREGVQLRGPDLMRRRAFNRATKGDGFTLHVRD